MPPRAKSLALFSVPLILKRIDQEIWKGKTENVQERFNQAKGLAMAEALKRKRVTYPRTVAALGELLQLAHAWQQEQPRSRAEQAAQLRLVHKLLLEIANGKLEELPDRFQLLPEHQELAEKQPGEEESLGERKNWMKHIDLFEAADGEMYIVPDEGNVIYSHWPEATTDGFAAVARHILEDEDGYRMGYGNIFSYRGH